MGTTRAAGRGLTRTRGTTTAGRTTRTSAGERSLGRARGTTRTVWLVGAWAVKVPSVRHIHPHRVSRTHAFARGWCANLSEWRYRELPGVCAPVGTLFGLVQVYPRATRVEVPADGGPIPPAHHFPAPPDLVVDRTWPNLGALGPGRIVWVDYDQTDQNR